MMEADGSIIVPNIANTNDEQSKPETVPKKDKDSPVLKKSDLVSGENPVMADPNSNSLTTISPVLADLTTPKVVATEFELEFKVNTEEEGATTAVGPDTTKANPTIPDTTTAVTKDEGDANVLKKETAGTDDEQSEPKTVPKEGEANLIVTKGAAEATTSSAVATLENDGSRADDAVMEFSGSKSSIKGSLNVTQELSKFVSALSGKSTDSLTFTLTATNTSDGTVLAKSNASSTDGRHNVAIQGLVANTTASLLQNPSEYTIGNLELTVTVADSTNGAVLAKVSASASDLSDFFNATTKWEPNALQQILLTVLCMAILPPFFAKVAIEKGIDLARNATEKSLSDLWAMLSGNKISNSTELVPWDANAPGTVTRIITTLGEKVADRLSTAAMRLTEGASLFLPTAPNSTVVLRTHNISLTSINLTGVLETAMFYTAYGGVLVLAKSAELFSRMGDAILRTTKPSTAVSNTTGLNATTRTEIGNDSNIIVTTTTEDENGTVTTLKSFVGPDRTDVGMTEFEADVGRNSIKSNSGTGKAEVNGTSTSANLTKAEPGSSTNDGANSTTKAGGMDSTTVATEADVGGNSKSNSGTVKDEVNSSSTSANWTKAELPDTVANDQPQPFGSSNSSGIAIDDSSKLANETGAANESTEAPVEVEKEMKTKNDTVANDQPQPFGSSNSSGIAIDDSSKLANETGAANESTEAPVEVEKEMKTKNDTVANDQPQPFGSSNSSGIAIDDSSKLANETGAANESTEAPVEVEVEVEKEKEMKTKNDTVANDQPQPFGSSNSSGIAIDDSSKLANETGAANESTEAPVEVEVEKEKEMKTKNDTVANDQPQPFGSSNSSGIAIDDSSKLANETGAANESTEAPVEVEVEKEKEMKTKNDTVANDQPQPFGSSNSSGIAIDDSFVGPNHTVVGITEFEADVGGFSKSDSGTDKDEVNRNSTLSNLTKAEPGISTNDGANSTKAGGMDGTTGATGADGLGHWTKSNSGTGTGTDTKEAGITLDEESAGTEGNGVVDETSQLFDDVDDTNAVRLKPKLNFINDETVLMLFALSFLFFLLFSSVSWLGSWSTNLTDVVYRSIGFYKIF